MNPEQVLEALVASIEKDSGVTIQELLEQEKLGHIAGHRLVFTNDDVRIEAILWGDVDATNRSRRD